MPETPPRLTYETSVQARRRMLRSLPSVCLVSVTGPMTNNLWRYSSEGAFPTGGVVVGGAACMAVVALNLWLYRSAGYRVKDSLE